MFQADVGLSVILDTRVLKVAANRALVRIHNMSSYQWGNDLTKQEVCL